MSEDGVIERLNAALHQRYRIERAIGTGGMATVRGATTSSSSPDA
jgi:hypothetical protein